MQKQLLTSLRINKALLGVQVHILDFLDFNIIWRCARCGAEVLRCFGEEAGMALEGLDVLCEDLDGVSIS